jgi:glucose-1-phosphate adenylyltransferase
MSGKFLTLVLAGGRGNRLRPLTDRCAKPVVPFAGRRLIDFTLLNCLRSGIRDLTILTQYQAQGVHDHVRRHWSERLGSVSSFSSSDAGRPFRGTADAVRATLHRFPRARRLLVLAGDHVYRMDYRALITDHEKLDAVGTLSVVPAPRHEGRGLGVLAVDEAGLIEAFVEKPDEPPSMSGHPGLSLVSMGIYVFDRIALEGYLNDHEDATDFGHDVVPGLLRAGHRIAAHAFARQGRFCYWRDIADVDAYHGALMDLVSSDFDPGDDWPTTLDPAEPARFRKGPGFNAPGVARDAWIGPGSIVSGGTVECSVLGSGVRVEHHAEVIESVLLDGVVVGPHARLRRVVVDAGTRIQAGAVLGYGRIDGALPARMTDGGVTVVEARRAEARAAIRSLAADS